MRITEIVQPFDSPRGAKIHRSGKTSSVPIESQSDGLLETAGQVGCRGMGCVVLDAGELVAQPEGTQVALKLPMPMVVIGDGIVAPFGMGLEMSAFFRPRRTITQRKDKIAEIAINHARSFHPPWHEWVHHVAHVLGTQPRALQQLLDSAAGKSGMHLNPRKALLSDCRPFAIDVKRGRGVLVQRRNTENWARTRGH